MRRRTTNLMFLPGDTLPLTFERVGRVTCMAMNTDHLNWGILVAVFASTGAVAVECQRRGATPEELSSLASTLGEAVYASGGNWLKNKKGWEQLSQVRPIRDGWSDLLRDALT